MQVLFRILIALTAVFLLGGKPSYALIQTTVAPTQWEADFRKTEHDGRLAANHYHKPEKAAPSFSFSVLDEEEDTEDFHDHGASVVPVTPWLGASQFSPPSAGNATLQGIFPDVCQYPATCRRYVLLCVFRV
ncbi:MAG: hypothetical protein EOP52_12735 [Sphingobacteriales bacterium]|nr:MAG: hypothetical protein EOP52_12735 [Sphingobacteriales bacterium]